MKPDYKNWVPKGMIYGLAAGTAVLLAGLVAAILLTKGASTPVRIISIALLSLVTAACAKGTQWSIYAYRQFSYDGKRKLSKQIVEGVAEYVDVPKGGVCLDVGCGSGALTIACAKRNRNAKVMGIDRWGKEYASFSKNLCENNAIAEGVMNTEFTQGDAVHLAFADETFDAVTSNYVYHNITGVNKQELLLETLRVLKKGGTFAIHDIMSKGRYGDMEAFAAKLRREGYEAVNLIPTDNGMFMSKMEGTRLGLRGSTILVGRK